MLVELTIWRVKRCEGEEDCNEATRGINIWKTTGNTRDSETTRLTFNLQHKHRQQQKTGKKKKSSKGFYRRLYLFSVFLANWGYTLVLDRSGGEATQKVLDFLRTSRKTIENNLTAFILIQENNQKCKKKTPQCATTCQICSYVFKALIRWFISWYSQFIII